MLVTSLTEVLTPGGNELISMIPHNRFNLGQIFACQIVSDGKRNDRFQPELGVAVGCFYVNVHSGFFAAIEKETIWALAVDGRHAGLTA
jgi:hypothetical protein